MKSIRHILVLTGAALALVAGSDKVQAQQQQQPGQPGQRQRGAPGGGNFDPEEMRKRMMDRYREQLEVKEDDAWKLIEGRITAVMDARRETMSGQFGGFGGFGGRPPGGGGGGTPGGDGQQGTRGGRQGGGGTPNPDVEALQKAIEAKAPADEIKAKLEKVRASRQDKEAKLEKAQKELREVLTVRQEAVAVMGGLLK